MRGNTENRAENYIKKHQKYKKWLAFALCVSLFTGTVTLYMLNKPATAMTEEGAESLGLVLETADDDFEQGLIEQMNDADQDGGGETSDDEYASEESGSEDENGSEGESGWENYSDAGDSSASDKDYEASDDSSTASLSEDESLAAASESSLDEASKEAASAASSLSSKKTSLEVPDSVDLAKYITETVIERLNDDGEWEQISKSDIRPADKLRITFNYVLPKEAVASDDIYLDIPEEFGTAIAAEEELDDGKGSYEVTEDNQLKIQYSDEVKEEIISDAEEDDLQASLSLPRALGAFFNLFTLTVHAADGTTGSATVYTTIAGMTITGVSVTKNPEVKWVDGARYYTGGTTISSGSEVSDGEKLLFTLSYELATGTVSADNPSITYDLAAHDIAVYDGMTGEVYNNSNEVVGSFTVDTSGLVTITFDSEFASKNSTQEVEGTFYFVAEANADSNSEKTYKEYDFGDNVKFNIYIIKGSNYDLSIEKKASEYNETEKTIEYTVNLSSVNGSGTEGITLTDIIKIYNNTYSDTSENTTMTSVVNLAQQLKSLVVKKSDGTTVTPSITYENNQFVISNLEDLAAGEYYTITYTFNVPDAVSGTTTPVKVNNSAKAVYDSDKSTSYAVNTDISGSIPDIDKSGTLDKENSTVTWTIVLNSAQNNLNGYTLKDIMHTLAENGYSDVSTAYTGELEVTNVSTPSGSKASLKKGEKITIGESGYTFSSDDYSTYTFTYPYTYSAFDLKWGSLVNEATITKEVDGKTIGDGSTASQYVGTDTPPVEKEADGIDAATGSESTVLVKWNVTINAPIKRMEGTGGSEYWTFGDAIQDSNEYITDAQLSALESAIKSAGYSGSYKLEKGEAVTIGGVSGYKGFTIKFYEDLTSDLVFTYYTTGYIGEGNSTTSFKNKAYIKNQNYSSEDSQSYEPIIAKYDGNGNHDASTYDYYSNTLFEQGILTWRIKITIPENCTYSTLTATDTLPEGVTLIDSLSYNGATYYGLEVADNDSFNGAAHFENGTASYSGTTFTESVSGQNINISFDTSNIKGESIYIRVRAKIDSTDWTGATDGKRSFTNGVSLKDGGGNELGSDSQTQNITKTETALKKGSTTEGLGAKDTVQYTLEINENAADLLEGSDVLTLTDTLTAKSSVDFGVTLVAGKIAVYEVTKDDAGNETLTELSTDDYSYSVSAYETTAAYNDNGASDAYMLYSTIEFKIPDKKHLRIVYRYTFNSDTANAQIKVSNTATLKGIAIENNSADDSVELKIEEAGAKANIHGINIYKVDNENNAIVLEGAEFALYRWNAASSKWERIVYNSSTKTWEVVSDDTASEYVSDSTGLLSLKNLTYNQAYKLVETKAPTGYLLKSKPLYFYMPSADTTTYPKVIPDTIYTDGETVSSISQGTDVTFTNTKSTTSITINKYWENADDTMPDSITVKLGRRLGSETTEAKETYHSVHIEQRNYNNTILKYIGLPSVIDGSTVKVTFWTYKDEWNTYAQAITVNSVEKSFAANNSGLQQVTVAIEVTDDTVIKIKPVTNSKSFDYFSYELTSPASEVTSSAVTTQDNPDYMTLTLTKSGGWTTTLDNLDRYEYVTNEDGTTTRYQWLYYISEVNNVYYTAEYSDDCKNGINSGTLEFTNKRNDVTPYSLPKTGGIGEEPLKAAGFGFMGIALAGTAFTCVRRRKKSLLRKSR